VQKSYSHRVPSLFDESKRMPIYIIEIHGGTASTKKEGFNVDEKPSFLITTNVKLKLGLFFLLCGFLFGDFFLCDFLLCYFFLRDFLFRSFLCHNGFTSFQRFSNVTSAFSVLRLHILYTFIDKIHHKPLQKMLLWLS
jgi:hypothetical protein